MLANEPTATAAPSATDLAEASLILGAGLALTLFAFLLQDFSVEDEGLAEDESPEEEDDDEEYADESGTTLTFLVEVVEVLVASAAAAAAAAALEACACFQVLRWAVPDGDLCDLWPCFFFSGDGLLAFGSTSLATSGTVYSPGLWITPGWSEQGSGEAAAKSASDEIASEVRA